MYYCYAQFWDPILAPFLILPSAHPLSLQGVPLKKSKKQKRKSNSSITGCTTTPVDPYSNKGLFSRKKNLQDTGCIFWFFKVVSEDLSLQNQLVYPVSPEAMETTVRDVNVLLSFSAPFSIFSFCGVWYNEAKSIMRNQFMRN